LGRRRINDPLEGGLASKIYITVFPCPRTSYGIAKNDNSR